MLRRPFRWYCRHLILPGVGVLLQQNLERLVVMSSIGSDFLGEIHVLHGIIVGGRARNRQRPTIDVTKLQCRCHLLALFVTHNAERNGDRALVALELLGEPVRLAGIHVGRMGEVDSDVVDGDLVGFEGRSQKKELLAAVDIPEGTRCVGNSALFSRCWIWRRRSPNGIVGVGVEGPGGKTERRHGSHCDMDSRIGSCKEMKGK